MWLDLEAANQLQRKTHKTLTTKIASNEQI